jgi:hypothetical protein
MGRPLVKIAPDYPPNASVQDRGQTSQATHQHKERGGRDETDRLWQQG